MMVFCTSFFNVGKESVHAFHIKVFTLFGTVIFHRPDQKDFDNAMDTTGSHYLLFAMV